MGLPEVIKVDKTKCQHCLACLLVCPVKLCNIVEPDGISVNSDLCIGCGECIRACHSKGHKARTGIDDFSDFLQDIRSGIPCGVLVAPAAAVNFQGHFHQMLTALRNMGVKYIFDVSFGAEITTYLYLKLIESGVKTPIIAQPCPAIVSYIEIYHPELMPYLAPTQSPLLDAAIWVKSQPEYKKLKLAFLGPCFAKRREIHDPNTKRVVSYNVTFESLGYYFRQQRVNLEELEPSNFDTPEAERAVVYSQPGGLTETFNRFGVPVKSFDIPRVEGPQEVYSKYLPELKEDISQNKAPLLIDILNCQHGCSIGPAVTHDYSHYQVAKIIHERKEKQIKKHQAVDIENQKEIMKEYYDLIEGQNLDFSRTYTDNSANKILREPSREEEEKTWERLHKITQEERQINCASCGYGNCHGMMMAIVNGLNHVESCKYYLLKENEQNLNKTIAQAKEIEKSRDQIAAWNEVLEDTVAKRTHALQNLLNNAGQGFLSFGPDLLVNEEYSYECIRIFGEAIDDHNFSELIYPEAGDNKNFLDNLINQIFSQKDATQREVYLSLLPEEIEIKGKCISLEFKIISDDNNGESEVCMVILTDITEKRMLEDQMDQEKNTLKMVVKVVSNYNDFIQTIRDYKSFSRMVLQEIIASENTLENKVAEIFRYIHTFKGNFSQFNMTNIAKKLHDFESDITKFREGLFKIENSDLSTDDLLNFVNQYDIQNWFEEDINRLENVLGADFFGNEDDLKISKSKLIEIEKKIENILPPAECKVLIPELRKLRYRPFATLLAPYPDYIIKLAERYEKNIYPVEIETEEILVDPDRYSDFTKTLVHIFRNAIDHGLETIDERIEKGKDEYGKIKYSLKCRENQIVLSIIDDGRGIDCNKLKTKAVDKGFLSAEEASSYSKDQILNLIFEDNFSTKDKVSDISGRGVGLAAVKEELEKLGGSVEVNTVTEKGTEFQFKLPMEAEGVWDISISQFMKPIAETTQEYIKEYIGIDINSVEFYEVSGPDKIFLNEFTSFITIRGAMESLFVLSVDEVVLRKMVRNFVLDELTKEEEDECMEDVLAESTNTILGNSLKNFPGLKEMLVIDTPLSLASKEALVKYKKSLVFACSIHTEVGNLSLSLVISDKSDDCI